MAKGSVHHMGNVNLKGKKSKALSCGCCDVYNLKDKLLKQEHQKEMRNSAQENKL